MAAINTNGYTTADALDPNQNVVFDPMYNDLVPKATYDARRAGGTASPPTMQPQVQPQAPATAQWNAQQGVDRSQQAQIGARQAVVPYQQTQINASRTANAAQGNVYAATANTFPIQQAVIGAKGQVINAQGQQTAAQQGFIGQEQQANQATIGDTNAIIGARGNTADQTALAMYNEQQAGNNGIYSSEGLSAPQRVVTADNRGGALAPGVIGDVQTQEQRVTQMAQDRAAQRALQLKNAQYIVDLAGTNTQLAEQAAARIGLTLDSANLLVNEASNAANQAKLGESNAALDVNQANLGVTQAGIGVDQANLNYNISKRAPTPGDVPVIDPVTGVQAGWGTPAQAANAQLQFNQNQGLANAGSTAVYNQQRALAERQAVPPGLLGGFSQSELLSQLGNGILGPQQVRDELVRRYNEGRADGLNPQAANLLVQNYQAQHGTTTVDPNAPDPFDTPAEAAAKAQRRAAAGGAGAAAQSTYNTTAAAIAGAQTAGEALLRGGN